MTIEEICAKRQELEKELRFSLTIHEKSDIIKTTRAALLALRDICPHKEGEVVCPYCGKKI